MNRVPSGGSIHGHLDYSPDPRITRHDVRTALGPDADRMMTEANISVDELTRLINAETTMLPPIVAPDPADAPTISFPSPLARTAAGFQQGFNYAAGRAKEKAHQLRNDEGLATAVRTWKSRFLKGAVLAVMITLTGGGAAALAMNKNVTLNVDGEAETVRSFGDTVGEVLDDAGIDVGKHDALSPSPTTPVGDGGVITVERGRQLTLTVDGTQQKPTYVRATTVGEALTELGMKELTQRGTALSTPLKGEIPLEGMTLDVKTVKHITIYDGEKKPRQMTTTAVTAGEVLQQLGLKLGPEDQVEGGMRVKLTDGAEVRISRMGVSVINVEEAIDPPVRKIEDENLEAGKEIVEKEGKAGVELVTYKVTKRNGEEVDRVEVRSKVLRKAIERVVRVGTKQPVIDDAAVWDALAHCESTGDWSINTGNGFYGGLQFDKDTWDAYGGTAYAAYPHEASREQQIDIATRVRDDRGGYGAWPHCSEQLGLPR